MRLQGPFVLIHLLHLAILKAYTTDCVIQGVTRLLHFVRTKNLPYSTTDVKRVVSSCKICAEVKPKFSQGKQGTLIKAIKPMERLSIDFKGPVPFKYLQVIIDEYSRFSFIFPCRDMTTSTVIECLDKLFTLCGTPVFIHSDKRPAFTSNEFTSYLLQRRISSSKSSIYHPSGNGQAERTVQTVRKTIELALKEAGLSIKHWETVLPDAPHCIRSLLCTATNVSPHERFFNFQRRSCSGESFPFWMTNPNCKVYLRRFVRSNKTDPMVDEVEVVNVNPHSCL